MLTFMYISVDGMVELGKGTLAVMADVLHVLIRCNTYMHSLDAMV